MSICHYPTDVPTFVWNLRLRFHNSVLVIDSIHMIHYNFVWYPFNFKLCILNSISASNLKPTMLWVKWEFLQKFQPQRGTVESFRILRALIVPSLKWSGRHQSRVVWYLWIHQQFSCRSATLLCTFEYKPMQNSIMSRLVHQRIMQRKPSILYHGTVSHQTFTALEVSRW